jgi:exodeoxyribonuclease-1
MSQTIYWHDYETWGIDARYYQPSQFAGIRTDLELNEIGDELNILCQPLDDYLPDPEAAMVTGLTPQQAQRDGLSEPEFAAAIHDQLAKPGTIGAGYNSLRFDDNFTRVLFYRNFYPPYRREYENNNNRWDIIDLVRAMRALRPDGVAWPTDDEGVPTNRLELLTAANGLDHADAHDALSDVRATIALAKLLRQAQPKLYDYAFSLMNKPVVKDMVDSALRSDELLVHSTGMFKSQFCNTSVVKVIAQHPIQSSKYLVYDTRQDPTMFNKLSDEQLQTALFGSEDERGELPRLPVKSITLNKAPFLAPLAVLDDDAQQRIQLSIDEAQTNAGKLQSDLIKRIASMYESNSFATDPDADAQLYDGFVPDADSQTLARLREVDPSQWGDVSLADGRMNTLLQRFRARHHPQSLDEQQRSTWQQHRAERLLQRYDSRFMTYDEYARKLKQLAEEYEGNPDKTFVLEELQLHGQAMYPSEAE